jgi:hypothetical protein
MFKKGFDYADPRYRTLFANYGLASLKAQVIEKQLSVLIATIDHLGIMTFDVLGFRLILDQDKRTMGNLIRILTKKIVIPSELQGTLETTLEERNYLIHRFFITKGLELGLIDSIPVMNNEVISIGNNLGKTIEMLDHVMEDIQSKVDIPMLEIEEKAKLLLSLMPANKNKKLV